MLYTIKDCLPLPSLAVHVSLSAPEEVTTGGLKSHMTAGPWTLQWVKCIIDTNTHTCAINCTDRSVLHTWQARLLMQHKQSCDVCIASKPWSSGPKGT